MTGVQTCALPISLVFFGCGAAVIAGMGSGPTSIDILGISFAFGLAIVAMAYGIGPVSGCHVNPAVSFGVMLAGRMSFAEFVNYAIAQCLGALAGAAALYLILSGKASGWTGGLGQNGWGAGYLGQYNTMAAFIFEAVATFLFLVCILGVTQEGAPSQLAGLAIGPAGLRLPLEHFPEGALRQVLTLELDADGWGLFLPPLERQPLEQPGEPLGPPDDGLRPPAVALVGELAVAEELGVGRDDLVAVRTGEHAGDRHRRL